MDDLYPSTPGERFYAARKRAKLTQKDVAAAASVAQSTVAEFEGGSTDKVKVSSLVPMCAAVNATVEYIWTGARAARTADEDEAIALLRGAHEADRRQAMKALRGMLGLSEQAGRATKTDPALALEAATERALTSALRHAPKRKIDAAAPAAPSRARAPKPVT